MKPVEYWVCALKAGEPECWDGPYETAVEAHRVKRVKFDGPKFAVYRVRATLVPDPKRLRLVPAGGADA